MPITNKIDNHCFFPVVTEKVLLSVSTERDGKIESLQEIIISLTFQLRDKIKFTEKLNKSLRGREIIVTSYCMSLLLDRKPGLNKRVEEKKTKQHSTKAVTETTGNCNTI